MARKKQHESFVTEEMHKLEEIGDSVSETVKHVRDNAFARFPVLLLFLSTFGLVATFYGFEKMIDQIELFQRYPVAIFAVGVVLLAITGTLFKKL